MSDEVDLRQTRHCPPIATPLPHGIITDFSITAHPMFEDPRLPVIACSFQHYTGRPLIDLPPGASLAKAMWDAPRVIVAHGTETDPVFFYGNRLALELFEMEFSEFARLPSRFSAEPLVREERERLLERVERHGYIDDYAGVRISAKGRRFRIARATVWNLIDTEGRMHGQAASFTDWLALE